MWKTTKELADIFGISIRTVQRRAKKGLYKTRVVDGVGRGGKELQIWIDDIDGNENINRGNTSYVPTNDTIPKSDLRQFDVSRQKLEKTNDTQKAPIKSDVSTNDRLTTRGSAAELQRNQVSLVAKIWLSINEIAVLMGVSEQYIRKQCLSGGLEAKKVEGTWKVALRSLPVKYQDRYLRHNNPISNLIKDIKPKQEMKARLRAVLVSEFNKQASTKAKKEFIELYNAGLVLPKIFAVLGKKSLATIYRWDKEMREQGNYLALVSSGRHNISRLSDIEKNMILQALLQPTRPHIYTEIRRVREYLQAKGLAVASRSAYYRFVVSWRSNNYGQWVLAREGEKAFNDKAAPYIIRDSSVLSVGDVLIADGHDLNFQVVHPLTGKLVRAKLVGFLDWASRMLVGWSVVWSENIEAIHAAFRHACINLRMIPKAVYLDNGRAFKAKIFHSREMIEADWVQLGIAPLYQRVGVKYVHFALPYNAQSKPIERFFGTFNAFERQIWTYSGNSIQDKPARMKRNEKIHRRIFAKYGQDYPTVDEVNDAIWYWLRNDYGKKPHEGISGRCPLDVFEAGIGNGLDIHRLDYLMMKVERAKVSRCTVRINGIIYFSEALAGLDKYVRIRYDVHDWDRIIISDMDTDEFICEAHPQEFVHPFYHLLDDPEKKLKVKEQIANMQQIKHRMKKAFKKYTDAVASIPAYNKPILDNIDSLLSPTQIEPSKIEIPSHADETSSSETLINGRPLFSSDEEKYFWLKENLSEAQLTDNDKTFIKEFEASDYYQLIYGGKQ